MKPTPETLDCGHSVDCLDFEGNCTACDDANYDLTTTSTVFEINTLTLRPAEVAAIKGDMQEAPAYKPLALESPEPIVATADVAASLLLATAQGQVIQTQDDAETATKVLKDIKAKAKELDEHRRSMTRPMDDAKKRVMELFKPIETKLQQAELNLKKAILTWEQRQAEERRQALAEAERVAREETRRLAQAAAEQRALGNVETAAATEAMAMSLPTPALAPVTKLSGVSTRETWRADVTDILALCRGIVEGTVPVDAIEPNMVFLNGTARALKDAMRWPGVRAVREEGIVSR